MTTKLRAVLEQQINDFLENNCEDDDWPDGMCYDELVVDMSKAAELVFDSCMKGQKFAEDNCPFK